MTIEQIKTLPSYGALSRNGLTDANIIQYYSLPKGQRGAFFKTFLNPTPTFTAPPIPSRQMCSGVTFQMVDAEFRKYMQTTFTVMGKTYNMVDMGYTWKWNNNKSRFGVHKARWRNDFLGNRTFTTKSIELSRYMFEHAEKTLEDWVDTILHEIAHGIDFAIRGTSNHDGHWVRVAKAIGCSGERCGSHKVNATKKYEAVCGCGTKYTRHKLTHSTRYASCGRCRTALNWKQNF